MNKDSEPTGHQAPVRAIRHWHVTECDPDAVYAEALSEHYCTCDRMGERSAEHNDGRGISDQIGNCVFELAVCQEKGLTQILSEH